MHVRVIGELAGAWIGVRAALRLLPAMSPRRVSAACASWSPCALPSGRLQSRLFATARANRRVKPLSSKGAAAVAAAAADIESKIAAPPSVDELEPPTDERGSYLVCPILRLAFCGFSLPVCRDTSLCLVTWLFEAAADAPLGD